MLAVGRHHWTMYPVVYLPMWSSVLVLVSALPVFTSQHYDGLLSFFANLFHVIFLVDRCSGWLMVNTNF